MLSWKGKANIFDKSWDETGADITIYCDIALPDTAGAVAGSYGKGTFLLPSGNYAFSQYEQEDLKEAWREKKHSTTHLELFNMIISVLCFSSKEQKIMCFCDNKAAVEIAKARYSAVNNLAMEQLLCNFDTACLERGLSVHFKWQSREDPLPKVADALSRGEVFSPLFVSTCSSCFTSRITVFTFALYGTYLFLYI